MVKLFALSATEGETAKQWTARVRETRSTGASVEQTRISLDLPEVGSHSTVLDSVRSRRPSSRPSGHAFRCTKLGRRPRSRSVPAVEDNSPRLAESEDDQYEDVQAFLADHSGTQDLDAIELSEGRTETAKTNQARRFTKSTASGTIGSQRKSFRNEIDDPKRRTRCRKCGKLGHWARECRSSATGVAERGCPSATAAGDVEVDEHEVTFGGSADVLTAENVCAAGLIQSPGFWGG